MYMIRFWHDSPQLDLPLGSGLQLQTSTLSASPALATRPMLVVIFLKSASSTLRCRTSLVCSHLVGFYAAFQTSRRHLTFITELDQIWSGKKANLPL